LSTPANGISSVRIVGKEHPLLPRMWIVFVFACLVFSLVAAARILIDFPGIWLTLIGLAKVAGLIVLFLWSTLRDSLTREDISQSGISRSTLRRRLLFILGMLVLNVALIPVLPQYQLWWLLLYPMAAAGLTLPLIPAKVVIGGLTALSFSCAWLFNDGFQPILLSQAVLALVTVIIRILTVTNIRLEASNDDVARLAVTEERLRFSRDLHDSLGHTLSTIVLKSELGSRLVEQDPERAAREMQDVEQVGRDALREVRSVVTGYRQPTLIGEIEAARRFLSSAGIALDVDAVTDQLPEAIDSVLAWGVREGTTNIIRHSDARHCIIRVSRADATVRLELIDDGAELPTGQRQRHSGSGLTGLSERVQSAGGRLTAGARREGGFKLVLETPVSMAHA
jgi:two-component system, NarL family, sensor histidine kinase DesK